jgi:RHS repeat-associated protein
MGARKLSYYNEEANFLNSFSKKEVTKFFHDPKKSTLDYYPFGVLLPNRHEDAGEYRYGFNGKEKDDEVSGEGNSYDYGFRIYNPRLGKFLSMDPLIASYPWYTPYQFAGNKPIISIDLDGKEEYIVVSWYDNNRQLQGFIIVKVPISRYIEEEIADANQRIKDLEGYIEQEQSFIDNGADKKAGKKRIKGYQEELAFVKNNKASKIAEIEANYYGKVLHVEKGASNYSPEHVSTTNEYQKINSNPTAYVNSSGKAVDSDFTDREKLILTKGAPAVDKIQGTTITADFIQSKTPLLADIPQNLNPTFNTNSSILDDAGKSELDKLYIVMTLIPDLKIELVGHTDDVGSPGTNQTLSEERAKNCKEYLVSKGIDSDRITTSGKGESSPAASNQTEEGRATNRRIEVIQQQ